jgi:hypothetical protein
MGTYREGTSTAASMEYQVIEFTSAPSSLQLADNNAPWEHCREYTVASLDYQVTVFSTAPRPLTRRYKCTVENVREHTVASPEYLIKVFTSALFPTTSQVKNAL